VPAGVHFDLQNQKDDEAQGDVPDRALETRSPDRPLIGQAEEYSRYKQH
jgi:hypothetical protein